MSRRTRDLLEYLVYTLWAGVIVLWFIEWDRFDWAEGSVACLAICGGYLIGRRQVNDAHDAEVQS